MPSRSSVCLLGLSLGLGLHAAGPGLAQGPGTPGAALPTPGVGAGAADASGGALRRPQGIAPLGGTMGSTPPPPMPRPLTAAELEELRQRMLGGSRGLILKPDEIAGIRRSVQDAQGAANFPGRDGRMPRPEPRIIAVTEQVSVSSPETLHLAYGVVSPIAVIDGKGRPWPIASVAYDPRLFAQDGVGCGTDAAMGSTQVAAAPGADRPTVINLMPCRYETWGNILIRLEGVPYPIPLMVLSGGGERVDIPVTIRVAGSSPLQPVRSATAGPRPTRAPQPAPRGPAGPDGSQLLHLFAAGTPPRGAVPATASSGAQAWLYRDRMYVRTQGALVSPQPVASAEAPDGARVYEFLTPTSRLIAERGDGAEVAIVIEF